MIPPGREHLSQNLLAILFRHTVHDEIHGVHLHQCRNPELILLILQYGVVQRQTVLLVRDGEDSGKVTVAPEKQIRPGQVAVMTKIKEQQILRRGVLLLLGIAGVLSLTDRKSVV